MGPEITSWFWFFVCFQVCSCLRFNWLQSVGKGSKADYLWLTVKSGYKKGSIILEMLGRKMWWGEGGGVCVCTNVFSCTRWNQSFAVSAVWFKLKINPLTFTVSNHLQMDHQLYFFLFFLLSGWRGAFFLKKKKKGCLFMQLGLLKGSEANLIKNSTWLNSAKSYKQKKV